MTTLPRFTAIIPAGGEYQFFTSIFAPTPGPDPSVSRAKFCMVVRADPVLRAVGPDHDIRIGTNPPTGHQSVMMSNVAQPRIATAAYPGAGIHSADDSMKFLDDALGRLRWLGMTPDRAIASLAKHVTFDIAPVPRNRGVSAGSVLVLRSVVLFREYMADEIEAAHFAQHEAYSREVIE